MADYGMSPQELNVYQTRANKLRADYATQRAQSTYQRGLLDQGYQQQLGEFNAAQDRTRSQMPGRAIRRGVLHSGIYKDALQEYAAQRLRGFQGLTQGYQGNLGLLALREQQTENDFQYGLQGLEAERLARQAELASLLRSLQ